VNVLSDDKYQQVIALGRLGWSLRRIEEATTVRRETASTYLKAAGIPVRSPRTRRAPKPASRDGVSTDSEPAIAPSRAPAASACEPYRELIESWLALGRNAMAIWQDLVSEHGFEARYASVRRFTRKLHGARAPEERVVIETAPGHEAQVDYGEGPMVRHPETGKYRRTRLFVLTLGFSRKSVRLLVWKSSSRAWAELHEQAFRRLGGATAIVVHDNLKEGVLTPDIFDPKLNPLYRDVLAHYGATALPCRIGDPDRKGKVESGIGHTQRTPLKGLRFESIEDAQAYLDRWDERWADTRIHGTTKRQVAAMFADERPHLLPLPVEPFRYYQYGERTVHHEDALFLGPPGTGKSHLAQAIGFAVIQQGYRVLYREAHVLLEELAEAQLAGERKEYVERLSSVPLLIIDDLGMRKLPPTAAEDLLEIIMRRYERVSTLLTSNRPVDDWGKLLGDNAAVTAMLDRLLHHAHLLKCGPRSWRTKLRADLQS
jgi:DNA replication protein DnaC